MNELVPNFCSECTYGNHDNIGDVYFCNTPYYRDSVTGAAKLCAGVRIGTECPIYMEKDDE